MKKIFTKSMFVIFLITLNFNTNLLSEIIYTDLIPDKILSPAAGSGQNYQIDMNVDNAGEFYIQVNNMSEGYESVKIAGIIRGNQIAGDGDTNDVMNFFPLCLALNEVIGENTSYLWFNNWDEQWDHELSVAICGFGINEPGHWAGGLKDKYLGVRFIIQGNYHYGWLSIEIPAIPNTVTIKGFAYESTPNLPIKAGETVTGFNENTNFVNSETIISPNPASEYIEIKLSKSFELSESYSIEIFNVYSEQMTVGIQNFEPLRIDISGFPVGIYFLRIGDEIQKFVVIKL
ncbi:MAG: T9SS type A sorting domain-containing protein [bacterium]